MNRARGFFDQALKIDPDNVEALVFGASTDMLFAQMFSMGDRLTRFASPETALTKALSLAPGHALAQVTIGILHLFTSRVACGIAQCERALALNRNLAVAHATIGLSKSYLGRFDETEPHIREALRLSPHDTFASVWLSNIGLSNFLLGKYDEAIRPLLRP